jgi:hypothetical protein
VWLYVLRTCVCIAVFDFRAYDRQLKTKLQFREESTIMHVSEHGKKMCQIIMSHHLYSTCETRQDSIRAVAIARTDDFLRVFFVAAH